MNKDFNYKMARTVGVPIIKCFLHPTIIGKEHIPSEGPIILSGNHLHAFDQFPVICATNRTIHWMAKKEYFDGKLGPLLRSVGTICVDRYGNPSGALKEALRYLRQGSAIGIFPEGTRNQYQVLKNRYLNLEQKLNDYPKKNDKEYFSMIQKCKEIEQDIYKYEQTLKEKNIILDKNEFLLPFHNGAIALAKKTNALVVPFGVTGDYTINNDNLVVRFDEPFKVEGDIDEYTKLLNKKVLSLVKRNYQEFGRNKK